MQLFRSDKISTDGKEYITCRECSHIGGDMHGRWYCNVIDGNIGEPSKCWCIMGLVDFWVSKQKPEKVLELIPLVVKE